MKPTGGASIGANLGIAFARRFGLAAAFFLGACAPRLGHEVFSIDGRPLENICLADDEQLRVECVDHISAVLDQYHRDDRAVRNPFVACYLGELSTMQTVGIQGFRQILELDEWLNTLEGKARTASSPQFVENFRELQSKIEPARDAIRYAREKKKMRWLCRLSPFV